MHIPYERNNGCGGRRGERVCLEFRNKCFVYIKILAQYRSMVFKMLILLGFFAVRKGSFIHSDIHRRCVDRVDYPVQNLCALTGCFVSGRFA